MLDGPPRVAALPGRCDAAPERFEQVFGVVLLGVGEPGEFSGGGLWYPPAVDAKGDVYLGVANPGLWPNSPKNPNGALRPGPNLYTDSLVVLDGSTGKLKWYRQVIAHDVRDYDLMIAPVLFTPSGGSQLVIGAGKMGKVFAWNAATGASVWQANVGKHLNDTGLLPKKPVTVCPGDFGGIETPMAQANGTLFVPWLNLCAQASATTFSVPGSAFAKATGGLTAFDAATGKAVPRGHRPHAPRRRRHSRPRHEPEARLLARRLRPQLKGNAHATTRSTRGSSTRSARVHNGFDRRCGTKADGHRRPRLHDHDERQGGQSRYLHDYRP